MGKARQCQRDAATALTINARSSRHPEALTRVVDRIRTTSKAR